jgi:hypothetical protein
MGIVRSYFSKSNTLVDATFSNSSQNPVTEISYGTVNKQLTRFIFDIDFSLLLERINQGIINPNNISKHTLKLTNTIQNAQEYTGKRSYSLEIERASSFNLELFNISEDWDEGAGYDFSYSDNIFPQPLEQASNWYYRKTDIPWSVSGGSYVSGSTAIFGNKRFEKGNEDLEIDITNYINGRLISEGVTGITGYTGTSYGLGVKFTDLYEQLETIYRQAVAFHTQHTHTFYEPFIETTYDDKIIDDRDYFYLDKDNYLYFYSNVENITINNVTIYDYQDNLITTISGSNIINVTKGIYKILLNIQTGQYPDSVIFRDVWNVTINGQNKEIENRFYLINSENYYGFNLKNKFEPENYYFKFWGINQGEEIVSGDLRKIKLTVRELYPNQNNNLPLNVEFRLFTKVGSDYHLDVIPYTAVNRTVNGFEFNLDTAWLIPQDYWLQIRLKDGSYCFTKESLKFTVVSNEIKNN